MRKRGGALSIDKLINLLYVFHFTVHSRKETFILFEMLLFNLVATINRLLNHKGSLLAYAGSEDKDVKVTAAVASNIWAAYEKGGKMAFHNEGLKFMFLNCEVIENISLSLAKLFDPRTCKMFFQHISFLTICQVCICVKTSFHEGF